MNNIAVIFGGESPEHEVSVISGLQVLRNIDRVKYSPLAIYIDKKGIMYLIENYTKETDFQQGKRVNISWGKDENGGYFQTSSLLKRKYYVKCAYLTLHGGNGELGVIQGLMDSFSIPYTSPNVESSALCMNKQISKIMVSQDEVPVVKGISIFSKDIKENVDNCVEKVLREIGMPLIIKPVHLGSSIGVAIAKSEIEVKKGLMTASLLDTEILVEKFLSNISEYNISVASNNGEIILSEIEKPIKKDEILSFKDKYQQGSKGKLKQGGMASLTRELPAKIPDALANEIRLNAQKVYKALRCKGQVRIDFIYADNQLYFSEINPIPGALAFFLWEAKNEKFIDQITRVIENAILDRQYSSQFAYDYTTDIVDKYIKAVNNKDQ